MSDPIDTRAERDAFPVWRSMLFIPTHIDKFVDKGHTRGADALILDLEDSVPETEKVLAREKLLGASAKVSANGADVLVRINARWRLAIRDLEAAIDPGIKAIVVPKVASAQTLIAISDIIDELETERNMPLGSTALVALIESPAALSKLGEISDACPRLLALIIGSEDFSAESGMLPNADNLQYPNQQLLFAARAAGRLPLGYVGSIADYSDLDAFKQTIIRARNMGFRGGFCIHPSQVEPMNTGFSPSLKEVQEAQEIVNAFQQALKEGRGAVQLNGKMVDAPVVARAQEVLSISNSVRGKG